MFLLLWLSTDIGLYDHKRKNKMEEYCENFLCVILCVFCLKVSNQLHKWTIKQFKCPGLIIIIFVWAKAENQEEKDNEVIILVSVSAI